MAERQIEIVIKASDLASSEVDGVISKITGISPKSEKMSKDVVGHSGLMRLGMFSVGESVEAVVGQFGVMGKAGRQVGNVVEGLVGGLGSFAGLVGPLAIAIGGVAMIWNHFSMEAKKAREELDRSISSLSGEVDQLYKNIPVTEEYNRHMYNSLIIKREILQEDLEKKIALETEEMKKLSTETKTWYGLLLHGASARDILSSIMGKPLLTPEQSKQLKEMESALEKDLALQGRISQQPSFKAFTSGQQDQDALAASMTEFMYRELAIGKTGDDLKLMQMDQHHAQEIQKLQEHGANQAQIETAQNIQRLERERVIADQAIQIKRREAETEAQLNQYKFNSVNSILTAVDALTKGKYKAIFLTMRGMAAAQAIIHGEAAATAAIAPPPLGLGPVAGAPLALWARIQGYTAAAAIMAQAFMGSGGGGGGGGNPPGPGSGEGAIGIPSGGGGGTTYETHITIINPLDGADVQRMVEQHVLPAIRDAENRNVQ